MNNFLFEGDERTYKFVINQIKYLYHKKKIKKKPKKRLHPIHQRLLATKESLRKFPTYTKSPTVRTAAL